MAKIEVSKDRCKGCGLCIVACPFKLLEFSKDLNAQGDKYAVQNTAEKCTGCSFCGMICPDAAIDVYK